MSQSTRPERLAAAMLSAEIPPARISLYESYITASLESRPAHITDYGREQEAMQKLVKRVLGGARPLIDGVLATALELCKADTAGVCVLQGPCAPDSTVRWLASAGEMAAFEGMVTPFDGPAGITLATQKPQLFRSADRHFPGMKPSFAPPLLEELMVPWNVPPATQGCLAIATHRGDRHFDSEDMRILKELASFVATGIARMDLQLISGEDKTVEAAMDIARQLGHHINNPLQTASMALELMADPTQADMHARALPVARQQLERITRIVYELLEYHRLPTPDDLTSLE